MMLKKLALTAAIALLAACSSSDDSPATTTPPVVPPTGGGGESGTPTGTTEGSWTGTNEFGTTYTIIDGNGSLYGFTDNGAGQFRTTFGNIAGALEQFQHRASDNTALGEAPTVVGDPEASVTYNFSVSADGSTLSNSSDAGAFSLSVANFVPVTVAGVTGNWQTKTAFGPNNPLTVDIAIAADGSFTGTNRFTFNDTEFTTQLSGTVSGSGAFLGVSFDFDGQPRSGVMYLDPNGSGRLVMNTVGPKAADAENESFTAIMTRQ